MMPSLFRWLGKPAHGQAPRPWVLTRRITQTARPKGGWHASPWLLVGLIGLGIALRLVLYCGNRSLWLDEAMLANNIVGRHWSKLLRPLDFDQAAPVGFVLQERFLVRVFGPSEMSLRLWPLVAGIAALILFPHVARKYLPPGGVAFALAWFAVAPSLVYYAAEVKPYGCDAFWVVVLYALADPAGETPRGRWQLLGWALIGAAVSWFSFPAVFVLAGLGTVWGVGCVRRYLVERNSFRWGLHERNEFRSTTRRRPGYGLAGLAFLAAVWTASFAGQYALVLHAYTGNEFFTRFWARNFLPLPPTTLLEFNHWPDNFLYLMRYPLGLVWNEQSLAGLGIVVILVGAAAFWKKSRLQFALLAAPLPFTVLAAALYRYPFGGRLVVFLVPLLILFLAQGVTAIRAATAERLPLFGFLVPALMFLGLGFTVERTLSKPPRWEETRNVLGQVRANWREGDRLYVHYAALPGFRYYAPRFRLDRVGAVVGAWNCDDWHRYRADLEQFRGRERVWVLLSHQLPEEEKFFRFGLAEMGTRLDEFSAPGAVALLYDLSD